MVQLSHLYRTPGKTVALTTWIFIGKVMSLLFNMLSRFVIAFLPESKRLLISWLQFLSTVILEPKKIKSVTVSIFHIEYAQSYPTLCDPMDSIAQQVPLSMEFSRQEYWSGVPFPSPGNFSNSGIEPRSPTLQVVSLPSEPPGKPRFVIAFLPKSKHLLISWLQSLSTVILEPKKIRPVSLCFTPMYLPLREGPLLQAPNL